MTYKGCTQDVTVFAIGQEFLEAVVWLNDEALDLDEDEYINARHKARHPQLCMKHALEIGYEFRKGQKYLFGGDPDLEPFFHTFLEGEGVDPKQNPSHEEIIWFKPVDSEYNPTHGEAEAVVNAWKEGE
jgi:hypothetical protein